jgi:SET domain-containing protein
VSQRTIVKPSTEKNGGYGLFAKAKILKDEVIHGKSNSFTTHGTYTETALEYVGEIIGGPEADRRE